MAPRLELHAQLKEIAGRAYFQPPEDLMLVYPCIIYNRELIDIKHADNVPYKHAKRYQVTVVDPDADSDIPDKVALLPSVTYDRFFTTAGLNHDVFHLFF